MKIITILFLVLAITSCKERKDYFIDAPARVTFSDPVIVDLPLKASYAEKRKFIDLNCDGVEDMLEVIDTKFFGQEYKARVFLGYKNKHGYLAFSDESRHAIDIPLDKSWSSSLTKIDSADVNGDGCGDLVFTEYKQGFSEDSYIAKIAINQGDGKTFKFATDTMFENVSLEEAILRIIEGFDNALGGGDDLATYLAMDWSDANGDGRDDLHIFWKDYSDLYVSVLVSAQVPDILSEFSFSDGYEVYLQNYMRGRIGGFSYSATSIDTEDFNGDGIGDIILHERSGSTINLFSATGSLTSEHLTYEINQSYSGKGADLNFFSFEKVDTFDANFDGCADYVHLGELEQPNNQDKLVSVYKFSKCS